MGRGDGYVRKTLIAGSDSWTFSCDDSGAVVASGLNDSVFALYHNRNNLTLAEQAVTSAHAAHVQAVDGAQETALFRTDIDTFGCLLVLCSHSAGAHTSTSIEQCPAVVTYPV